MIDLETGLTTLLGDATLVGLAGGGVHKDLAPEEVTARYVSFSWAPQSQEQPTLGDDNGYLDALITIKVVDQSPDQTAASAAFKRLNALVMGTAGDGWTATNWHVMGVVRESRFSFSEVTKGRRYQHVGARYRVSAQPT